MHINIAVSKALVNKRDNQLKTTSLGNEVVYYCSPNHSINNTLDTYGLKNCSQGFFAVFLNLDAQAI